MKQLFSIFSLILFLFFSFFTEETSAQGTFNVGVKEGTGNQVIVYFTATNYPIVETFKDFTVTLKWPSNTVGISSSFSYGAYNLLGSYFEEGGYNYLILNTSALGSVNFVNDGSEYNAFRIDYTHSGTACSGQFEIENGTWASANNGTFKLIANSGDPWPWKAIGNSAAGDLNPVKISNVSVIDVTCRNESTGSIDITGSSATGTYEYSIDNVNYQLSNVFADLPASSNKIPSIKNSDGCIASSTTVSINQPTSTISISSQVATDISCNNANDGEINITANGGTGNLTYSITEPASYLANGGAFTNLSGGNYTIRVRDENNCVVTGSVRTVNNPGLITITSQVKTDISCFGDNNGTITVEAQNGTGAFIYSKDNGVNYYSNGGFFTNLPQNSYTIKVKDGNSCEVIGSSFTVLEPSQIVISNINTTAVTFCTALDGEINVAASGGTGNLQYSRDGILYQAGNSFAGLGADDYTIYVKDESLCIVNQDIVLSEEFPIVIDDISTSELKCYGDLDGEIVVTASGGFPPLIYSKDNTNYYKTNIFSNLQAASYPIYVKDTKNCIVTAQGVIENPNEITLIVADFTDVTTCYGDETGMLRLTSIGGTGILTYSIDGVNFQTSSQFLDIIGGSYDVTVLDENMCETTISTIINRPSELISNISISPITCFEMNDASVRIAPQGGTPNYNIVWSIIDGDSDDYNLTDIVAGNYTVTITDSKSCEIIEEIEITEPAPVVITAEIENLTCFDSKDGSISTYVSGGELPYSYKWNNNQNKSKIIDIDAGSYRLTVRDFRQCVAIFNAEVTEPEALNLALELTNTSYFGSEDGSIVIDVKGGTDPYLFTWSNGKGSESIYNLPKGEYSVTVEDFNYCTKRVENIKISTDQSDVEIPSAFTPNGDGKNDTWILKSVLKYPEASLKIFDSRGYLVYTKEENVQGWDGTDNSGNPLPGSTLYYYVLEVNNNTAPFKGTIYIIR